MLDGHQMPEVYTVRSICDLYQGFYNNWNQERLEGAFQELGVLENERIGNLSRGEYFRVQLALGLAHQADIFLLDEAGLEMESGYPGKSI